MEASIGPSSLPNSHSIDPITEKIKQRLLKKGVFPTPKIIHTLRKKELQKSIRKSNRIASQSPPELLTPSQKKTLSEDFYFKTICREYKDFNKALDSKSKGSNLVGKPWEPLERENLRDLASGYEGKEPIIGGKLKSEHLRELGLIFQERKSEALSMFLDDDIEVEEGMLEDESSSELPNKSCVSETEAIGMLVDRNKTAHIQPLILPWREYLWRHWGSVVVVDVDDRLSAREITAKDWKFTRAMKHSGLRFMEGQMLRIVEGLGDRGAWKQAMEVVEWVYSKKEHSHYKSRFVYTKLLAILGKARRPHEARQIFRKMLGDRHIYPDMAAYRSIAVTLGQAGMVRELMTIIECMKEKPSKTINNMCRKNWDPSLQPDIVVFNSVLNACVPSRQWKGVSWVFEQLRKGGLKANGATYGLAMEVMLNSEKYDLVHELFLKMKRNGCSLKALTYKVLVKTFWKEGKVDEAIHIVRDMEQRGIIGSASVYYELACCLCNNGRWREAVIEIEKLKNLRHSKPFAIAFTGLILSAMDGGHVDDCTSIFEHMQNHCAPNIGTINAMLKIYGHNDMFFEAKELFEKVKRSVTEYRTSLADGDDPLIPDAYTYGSMLEASGRAHQWEFFEYIYKEMCVFGYHLDQDKHAALLVEASRAGKWHLLEHAFDITLEAGEIPHPVLFSEMVFQATSRGDYEKAASIVGAIVHAPFQLKMKDWTGLLEKNKDMIGDEHLEKLSETLQHRGMAEQSSASELLKALHAIFDCVPSTSVSQSLPIISCSHKNSDGWVSYVAQNADDEEENNVNTTEDMKLQAGNFDCDRVPQFRSKDGEGSADDPALSLDCDTDEDDTANPFNLPSFVDYESSADLPDDAFDEEPPDEGDSEVNECTENELPSADEILQLWEQMRKEDRAKFSV